MEEIDLHKNMPENKMATYLPKHRKTGDITKGRKGKEKRKNMTQRRKSQEKEHLERVKKDISHENHYLQSLPQTRGTVDQPCSEYLDPTSESEDWDLELCRVPAQHQCWVRDLLSDGDQCVDRCRDQERWYDLERCRKSNRCHDSKQCWDSKWCHDSIGGKDQSITGLPQDGAVRCGTGGLAQIVGDLGAVMARRSLAAAKVSRVDGSSTSLMIWPGESNSTDSMVPLAGLKLTVPSLQTLALGTPHKDVPHWLGPEGWGSGTESCSSLASGATSVPDLSHRFRRWGTAVPWVSARVRPQCHFHHRVLCTEELGTGSCRAGGAGVYVPPP
ncbi:hypothetical protein UY3_03895 [Chelonia mydas]|uniref:Uncharacterized protein n=1 Tax=Chelonia mydas TaxID=8469 RepID=M7BSZ3_CHEMY|nr:hypothetical protein UY3_03895 [Chelonia mydas]